MADEQELVIKISAKNLTKEGFAEARSAIAGLTKETEKGKPAARSFFEQLRDGKVWTDALTGTVAKFAAGFTLGALFQKGAGMLIDFARTAVSTASEVLTLSKTTGLSTDAIQRFQIVAAKSNSTLTDWTNASYKLGLSLAGGDESVKGALDKLGLSYDQIRKLSPEQQFVAIADKLRVMRDETERNKIGSELFGKGWKEIAAGVVDGHFEIASAAEVATRQQLESLNRLSDEWSASWAQMQLTATAALGTVARAASVASGLSLADWAKVMAMGGNVADNLNHLADRQDYLAGRTKNFGKDIKLSVEPAVQSYGAQLKEAAAEVAGMTAATKAEILAAAKLGVEEDILFRKFDINKGVLALLKDEQQKHTETVKEATRKAEDRREALDRIRKAEERVTDAQRDSILQLKKREIAEGDIAIALGVTAAQIKQVIEADEKSKKIAGEVAEERGKRAQLLNERLKEVNAQQLKLAEEKAAREVALLQVVMEAERQRALRGTHGAQKRLIEIAHQERDELASMATRYNKSSAFYGQLETLIKDRYQHERDLANGTASTIEERMRAQGVVTRTYLRQTASDARRDYDQMKDAGIYTAEQLREAWKKWYDADKRARGDWTSDWFNTLDRLGAMFEQAANIGGETFGGIARWLGTVVSASKMAVSGADDFKQGLGKISDGDTVGGLLDVAAGVVSIVSALDQATSSGNRFQRVMGGAMVGAQAGASIGGLFGPIGTAVGAAAGGIIGGLVGMFRKDHVKETMKEIGREYGVKISEGLAKEINELAKKVSGPTDKARKELAALLSLDKIIAEGGGVTSANVGKYSNEALALFDVIKRGGKDGAAAVKTLGTVFSELEPVAAKAGHVADAGLLQIVVRARAAGTEVEGITAFLDKHLQTATTGLGEFAKANFDEMAAYLSGMATHTITESGAVIPSLLDDWKDFHEKFGALSGDSQATFTKDLAMMKSVYQQDFTDLGIFSDTTFRALIGNGRGFLEALNAVAPALDAMIDGQKKLGFEGDESFNKLLRFREIAAANEPLLRQIGSMNDLMLGLGNAVGVDQAAFDAFGRQATSQMNKLTEAGFESDDALKAMAPSIQTLIELQDRFGFKTDDATQALIDEARAAGVVGEQHKSASERMVDGLDKVIGRLDAMLVGMGFKLPEAVERGTRRIVTDLGLIAGGVQDAIDRIPNEIRVGVRFDVDDMQMPGGIRERDGGLAPESYASGGIAVGRQMAMVGDSPSRKEIIGDIPFMTRALTGAIERLGGRPGGSGGPVNVYVAVDPSTGRARVMGESEKRTIQNWIYAGEIAVPQQNLTRRPA